MTSFQNATKRCIPHFLLVLGGAWSKNKKQEQLMRMVCVFKTKQRKEFHVRTRVYVIKNGARKRGRSQLDSSMERNTAELEQL